MARTTKPAARRKATTRAPASGGFPVVPVLIGAVVVLAIAAIIAVALTGGDDGTPAASSTCEAPAVASSDTVTVRGAALSKPEGATDPCIGHAAPALTGHDFANEPVEITNDGRAKAIMFVAHWCPHCQREVPIVANYLETAGLPEGVDLYLVPTSTDTNLPNYPPDEWLQREGLGDIPTLVDDGSSTAHLAYGGGDFPYLVLVGKDGKVAGRFSGELGEDAYPALFDALAKGEPIPGTQQGPGSTSPDG
jgi:thiol-disulfide isomerase/thioredoxin